MIKITSSFSAISQRLLKIQADGIASREYYITTVIIIMMTVFSTEDPNSI